MRDGCFPLVVHLYTVVLVRHLWANPFHSMKISLCFSTKSLGVLFVGDIYMRLPLSADSSYILLNFSSDISRCTLQRGKSRKIRILSPLNLRNLWLRLLLFYFFFIVYPFQ